MGRKEQTRDVSQKGRQRVQQIKNSPEGQLVLQNRQHQRKAVPSPWVEAGWGWVVEEERQRRVGAVACAIEGGLIGRTYIPHMQETCCLVCYFSHGGTWLALNKNTSSEQMPPQAWFISNLNLCWTLSSFLSYVVKWCLKRQRKLSGLDRAQF